MTEPAWHAIPPGDALAQLGTREDVGLTSTEAHRRLAQLGPNRIADRGDTPPWRLAARQFKSLVVLLLLAAAVVALSLGERVEAIAILSALLLNAAIGFGSEWRARISLASLRSLAVRSALVRRDGRVTRIPAEELVRGDAIVLEAGCEVPADARLFASAALSVREAPLTGESDAVQKDAGARLDADVPLALRRTMVYLGTTALTGSGLGAVTATGAATELGRIGTMVALAGERTTPLERQVEALGRRLIALAIAVCAIVGLAGIIHGEPVGLMLETAITLAVAAIPEGLPAVTSVALAAGLWRLARLGALVRRLPAVETLGSATVICADKTGTMTENQMTVTAMLLNGRRIDVTGGGRSESGRFIDTGRAVDPRVDPQLEWTLTAGALANDGSVVPGARGLELHGDPTDTALLVAAIKGGLSAADLGHAWPRRSVTPFDPDRRMMAAVHEHQQLGSAVFVKGAPEVILALSSRCQSGADTIALADSHRTAILEGNRTLASQGLRVLAVAWRRLDFPGDTPVEALTFLGLFGLQDPVRGGVQEAVAACARAGVQTVMLTGDQASTAEAVGRAIGLPPDAVRSRMTPEGKLHLIETLQAQGHVVAMTGDGINDAPALARADIGIAMGRHGTDVARAAADMVLTDDNFTTIAKAVEEGRVIYANLRKVIHFLFTCNLSEVLTVFVAVLLGLPAPLLPLQILWVNLVTDIFPAIALIRDPAEPDVMARPPRDPGQPLVTWRFGARMLREGVVLAAGVMTAYLWVIWQDGPGRRATTMAFMALVLVHPIQAISCRSDRLFWWTLPPNPLVWVSLAVLIGVQALTLWLPPLARLLGTAPLAPVDWPVLAIGVLWPVAAIEIGKAWGAWKTLRSERPTPGRARLGSSPRNRS